MKILKIYDNGGETMDRYTVVMDDESFNTNYICLGLSNNPTHPQGFSQWGYCVLGDHLGAEIDLTDLSTPLQAHIMERIK